MKSSEELSYRSEVKADFSKASATYAGHADVQHENYRFLARYAATAVQAIPVQARPESALAVDIGSGPGVGLGLFKQLCPRFQWVALDVSESMLQRHEHASHKILADMEQLPLASNSMVLVISNFAMHWSVQIEKAIEEALRVLKEKGVAVLSFPVAGSFRLLEHVWMEQGLQSPLHPMPDQQKILQFLQQQGIRYSSHMRPLPLQLASARECFQWLKQTGVRHKARAQKRMTKRQYLGIVALLTERLKAGDALEFKMMDVLLFK